MDPDECLKMCRRLAERLIEDADLGIRLTKEGEELAESFKNLDEWISRGGFLPDEWRNKN